MISEETANADKPYAPGLRQRVQAAAYASPQAPPMAKVTAANSKGRASPESAVKKANADHKTIAPKPMKVGRVFAGPAASDKRME